MYMPTVKAKIRKAGYKAIIDDVFNGEKLGKALKKQGYSDSTAINPVQSLSTSKTFQELLDDYLPNDFVLGEHDRLYSEHRNIRQINIDTLDDDKISKVCEGLGNVQAIKNEEGGYTTLLINEVDKDARAKAIEMAYKLRGQFSPIKIEVKRTYEDLTDKEILEMMKGE